MVVVVVVEVPVEQGVVGEDGFLALNWLFGRLPGLRHPLPARSVMLLRNNLEEGCLAIASVHAHGTRCCEHPPGLGRRLKMLMRRGQRPHGGPCRLPPAASALLPQHATERPSPRQFSPTFLA